MHNPRPGIEHAGPGWYWQPTDDGPVEYLGYNSIEAEIRLRELQRAISTATAAIGPMTVPVGAAA